MYTPVNKSTGVMPGAVMVDQSLHILLFTIKFNSEVGTPKDSSLDCECYIMAVYFKLSN